MELDEIVQSVVREPCPGKYAGAVSRLEWGLKWEDFLRNSRGKSPSTIPPLLCLHFSSCIPLLAPPPLPSHHLPPWAVNVNGCISLSLNFTYDFPGAKHSKQAPLSLSWNAPGDATHFRRVTRTRPCRAGSDVYEPVTINLWPLPWPLHQNEDDNDDDDYYYGAS